MIKKYISFLLCLCLFFSATVTVFAEDIYKLEKAQIGPSILTGRVTKISNDRIKLSKTSDDLWNDTIGAEKVDYIILDITYCGDTEFCNGDVITAYCKGYFFDNRSQIDEDDYVFELFAYKRNDQEISVEEMVKFLEGVGVFNGYEDGELHLEQNITRAEFTAIMVQIYGDCGLTYITGAIFEDETTFPFKDVTKDHWARECIIYAFANGIISGKNGDTFAPDENITIRDCIVVLLKASTKNEEQRQLLLDTAKFLGGYPDGYLKIAKENGLITDQLPEKIASRGDVAKILYKIL